MTDAPPVTIDNLRDDLERLKASIPKDAPPYIMEMLAFEDAKLDVMDDMDNAILDILEKHEDILQPETAGVFAIVIQGCLGVIGELNSRLNRKKPEDVKLAKALVELAARCKQAKAILATITTVRDDDDEAEEGDPEAPEMDRDDYPDVPANAQPETEVADADAPQ